jgi:hypothetical protein
MARLPKWGKKRQGAWVGRKGCAAENDDNYNYEEGKRLFAELGWKAILVPLVAIAIVVAVVFAVASFATHHYGVGMGIVVPMVVLAVFLIKRRRGGAMANLARLMAVLEGMTIEKLRLVLQFTEWLAK